MHAPGLYWYIQSKQELIDLMAKVILDEGLYPIPPLRGRQTWEEWLVELACTTRQALLAYRDGARVVASAYLVRTNAITPVIEQSLTILEDAGFDRLVALGGTMTILRYATGIALDEQASPTGPAPGPAGVASRNRSPRIDAVRADQPMSPSCLTASRSSASSATLASIRAREKSSMSSPSTICHRPSDTVTGKDEIRPSVTP